MARSVGFIGLGIMGRAMARRLVDAGFRVTVWNRDASKAADLVAAGAKQAGTPRAAAEGADVVITIVTDSAAVEAVILGPEGVSQGAKAGAIVVDMTTIHPSVARKVGIALKKQGVGFLDAPVTGMEFRAKDGTLSILVGGEKEDLALYTLPNKRDQSWPEFERELLKQQVEMIKQQIPTQSFGTPDDIAACALYLASAEARYVTGQTLHVNGGMVMP